MMLFLLRHSGATPRPKLARRQRFVVLPRWRELVHELINGYCRMALILARPKVWITGLLLLTVTGSSLTIIRVVHENRTRFAEWHALEERTGLLESAYSRLLLEESTYAAPARVEQLAIERYGLIIADPSQIEVVRESR